MRDQIIKENEDSVTSGIKTQIIPGEEHKKRRCLKEKVLTCQALMTYWGEKNVQRNRISEAFTIKMKNKIAIRDRVYKIYYDSREYP